MRIGQRATAAAAVVLPGAAAVYLSAEAGGPAAGAFAGLAAVLGLVLALRLSRDEERVLAGRMLTAVFLLLPAVLTVYLAFNAGGFYPDTQAFVAILLAFALAITTTSARDPFEGFGWPLAIAAGALGLFCGWTLLSGIWSDAPARALLEFDRALVYLLTLILFGSLAGSPTRLAWMVRGLALGLTGVAVCGLITRVLPEVWPIDANLANDRLSFPLTYWNALGLMAALGLVFCFHLTCSEREPRAIRVAGAAALPPLAATLLLTFSRGAIVVAILGVAVYAVLARPRGFPTGLLAAGPAVAVAVVAAYGAELLATRDPTTPAAVSEGKDLALVVGLCMLGAAVVRGLLLPLDTRLAAIEVAARTRRLVLGASAGLVLAVGATAFLTLGGPDYVERQYDRFLEGGSPRGGEGELRRRLSDPANNGRTAHWNVAFDAFAASRVRGQGAGTYQLSWVAERPEKFGEFTVDDGHSLYFEVLGELGLVGLVLLVVALATVLMAVLARTRGSDRALHAAVFAALLAWAVRAGADWDWEMPAVTLPFFALGGAAVANRTRGDSPVRPSLQLPRLLVAVGWLALAAAPALVLASQRQLDRAVAAFKAGDCDRAADASLSSISVLGARPEPYEVLGYCQARRGFERLGVEALERAIDRDPRNWEYHYALSLVRGAAGLDPRPAAREAIRLNPFDPVAIDAVVRFGGRPDPQRWERLANAALESRELIRAATPDEQEETPP